MEGGWLAARFGHRRHHLAPYFKLPGAWGDDLDGGFQPDVEDAPGRLDPCDLSRRFEVEQAVDQRRCIADRAPRRRDGLFDRFTCPLVGRQTSALSAD